MEPSAILLFIIFWVMSLAVRAMRGGRVSGRPPQGRGGFPTGSPPWRPPPRRAVTPAAPGAAGEPEAAGTPVAFEALSVEAQPVEEALPVEEGLAHTHGEVPVEVVEPQADDSWTPSLSVLEPESLIAAVVLGEALQRPRALRFPRFSHLSRRNRL